METMGANDKAALFSGATSLILIILKIAKLVDWSWYTVTSPIWGMFLLCIVAAILSKILEYILNKIR